ncbi:hypothetical protein BVC80_9079g112 [Macleaya cordata]|uniref:Uncharacterized protein n=1 Tax=Macleaya cordata TaxID=56857 RepID=A0A200PUV8_MACCD|nr:hypothetical protein BVC80_9079g112 [Macleaya cordata]
MGGTHMMKRIPSIKFPQRHPKPSGLVFLLSSFPFAGNLGFQIINGSIQGSASQPQGGSAADDVHHTFSLSSKVPAAPTNTSVGGKASLQPKRTPVSDKEIEAIMRSPCRLRSHDQ